jgi:two-component system, sensor histidine kinase LadS
MACTTRCSETRGGVIRKCFRWEVPPAGAMMWLLLASFLLTACGGHLHHQVEPELLGLEILHDASGVLGIEEVAGHPGFRAVHPQRIRVARGGVLWMRFHLDFTPSTAGLATPHPVHDDYIVLSVRPHFIDALRLYRVGPEPPAQWPMTRRGSSVPREENEPQGLHHQFVISPDTGGTEYYLAICSANPSLVLPMVFGHEAFHRQTQNEFLLAGVLLGLQLLLVIGVLIRAWIDRSLLALLLATALALHFYWYHSLTGMLAYLMTDGWPLLSKLSAQGTLFLAQSVMGLFMAFLMARMGFSRLGAGSMGLFIMASLIALALSLAGHHTWAVNTYLLFLLGFLGILALLCLQGPRETRWPRNLVLIAFGLYILLSALALASLKYPILPGADSLWLLHATLLVQALMLLVLWVLQQRNDRTALEQARAQEAERGAELAVQQRLTREQSYLLSMLAHEFRTPLALIRASSDALHELVLPLTPEIATRLARIEGAARNMGDLVERCVQLDRLETQGLFSFSRIDLVPLLRDLPRRTRDPGRIHVSAPVELEIEADEDFLKVSLSNLLANALQYSPPETPVYLDLERQDADCVITVRNQGPPIPEDAREKLFTKFWRANRNANVPGLGLGLYLAHGIAEMHGGTLEVDHANGEVQMRLRIPCSQLQKRPLDAPMTACDTLMLAKAQPASRT